MHRWHPIDHEHEYRQAVIERLDRITKLLALASAPEAGAVTVTYPPPPPPNPPASAPLSDDAWACEACGKTFGSEHALRVHKARAHKGR